MKYKKGPTFHFCYIETFIAHNPNVAVNAFLVLAWLDHLENAISGWLFGQE